MRCLECPIAYCMDCFPTTEEMTQVPATPQFISYFDNSGYVLSKDAVFFRCHECKVEKEAFVAREAERRAEELRFQEERLRRARDQQNATREARAQEAARNAAVQLQRQLEMNNAQAMRVIHFQTVLYKGFDGRLGVTLMNNPDRNCAYVLNAASHHINLQARDEVLGVNGKYMSSFHETVNEIGNSGRAVQLYMRRYTSGGAPSAPAPAAWPGGGQPAAPRVDRQGTSLSFADRAAAGTAAAARVAGGGHAPLAPAPAPAAVPAAVSGAGPEWVAQRLPGVWEAVAQAEKTSGTSLSFADRTAAGTAAAERLKRLRAVQRGEHGVAPAPAPAHAPAAASAPACAPAPAPVVAAQIAPVAVTHSAAAGGCETESDSDNCSDTDFLMEFPRDKRLK
jgi:hypothetical protein